MTFPVRTLRGVTILEPTGKITIGRGDIELRDCRRVMFRWGNTVRVYSRITRE